MQACEQAGKRWWPVYWFGWDRVNFLHSGLYGAMFWICGQNSIGNNTHVLAIAEQCLHSVKGFSAPHPAPPASRLGVHKKLGGDTAGTADPKWPKGYPTSYDAAIKAAEKEKGGMFRVMVFVFPSPNRHMWWSPAFLEMAEHLPADGK